MTRTIGNPLSWAAEAAFGAGRTAAEATEALRGHADTPPEVHRLTNADLRTALGVGAGPRFIFMGRLLSDDSKKLVEYGVETGLTIIVQGRPSPADLSD